MKPFFKESLKLMAAVSLCLTLLSCTALQPAGKRGEHSYRITELENSVTTLKESQEKLRQRTADLEKAVESLKKQQKGAPASATAAETPAAGQTEEKPEKKGDAPAREGDDPSFTEPRLLYQNARERLQKEQFRDAIPVFTEFLNKYPHHDLSDNAMYWIGECHYAMGVYEKAAGWFKKLVETYPDGMKVPDALLKTGYAYFSMSDTDKAAHYLKQVIKQFPFTDAAEKAQEKLKTLQ